MKTAFVWVVCTVLQFLCGLTHPFVAIEFRLTGRHCNITHLAFWIDERLDGGYWRELTEDERAALLEESG